ncbi:MAG: pyridoxal phosphate-dependent aminotransferase [bacterium]|nr:pyridoxal phosphate-dependent aminotransferase [bacterium]
MLHQPALRVNAITPALTLNTVARTEQLIAQGKKIYSLSVGEPDFNTPLKIQQAGKWAIEHGITKYTSSQGTKELRKAISEKLKAIQKLEYLPNQILVGNGAKQIISMLILATINPGDEVIIPSPYFLSYPEIVKLAGGVPVFVDTRIENRFLITAEELKNAITEKTKMVILCTPSNPTSTVYRKEELESLIPILSEKKCWILSDEVYEHLLFDGLTQVSPAHFPELYPQTLYISSFSKTYAMCGWRLGYCAGDERVIQAACTLQGHLVSSPNSISQYAGIEALRNTMEEVEEMRKSYQQRRDLMYSIVSQWENCKVPKPEGAFYCFVQIDQCWKNGNYPGSIEVANQLLEQEYVAVLAGKPFGNDNCIRLSFATDEATIIEGCNRIGSYLQKVQS